MCAAEPQNKTKGAAADDADIKVSALSRTFFHPLPAAFLTMQHSNGSKQSFVYF